MDIFTAMTPDERRELAGLAKALDTTGGRLSVRDLPVTVSPLGMAAVRVVLELDPHEGHGCVVCGMARRHRCSCPFRTLPAWVRHQERNAA